MICSATLPITLPARATPSAEEAVRFRYVAPSACPDSASFTARLRERTQRGRPAEPDELARTFVLSITPGAEGFTGEIEFVEDSGESVSRRVHGAACDEVVSSLALITALALDASLREEARTEPEPESELQPDLKPEPEPTRPAPFPSYVAAAPTQPVAKASRLLVAGLAVAAGFDSALTAPWLGFAGALTWPSGFSLLVTPHYSSARRTVDTNRRAALRLLGVGSEACPVRQRSGAFSFYPCIELDIGALRAAGVPGGGLSSTGSRTIFWVALGPQVRLAWEPQAPLWLELQGGVAFPLVSHEFIFNRPLKRVYQVSRVTAQGGVVAGVRFW